MRRAALEQNWVDMDAVDDRDRDRHPLRSRLRQPPPAAVDRPILKPAALPTPPDHATDAVRPAARPITVPAKRSLARRAGSALAYSMLGFVMGAVFWHFIGFWDFVGQVMFGARPSAAQISLAPPPIKLKDRVTGVSALTVAIEPDTCTTLELDRANGTTQSVACESQSLPLRSLRIAKREDLWVTGAQRIQEATARGWSSVTVERPGQSLEQASAD